MNCEELNKIVRKINNQILSDCRLKFPIEIPCDFEHFLAESERKFIEFKGSVPDGKYDYLGHLDSPEFGSFWLWRNRAIMNYVANNISFRLHVVLQEIFSGELYGCGIMEIKNLNEALSQRISIGILNAYRTVHKETRKLSIPIRAHHPEDKDFERPVIKFDKNHNIVHGDKFEYWAYKDEFAQFIHNIR